MTKELKQQIAVAQDSLEDKELTINKLLDEMNQLQRRIGDHEHVLWVIEEQHEMGLIDKTNPIYVTEVKQALQEISPLKTKLSELQGQYEALQYPIWDQEMRDYFESQIEQLRVKIKSHEEALGTLGTDPELTSQAQRVIDELNRELNQSISILDSLGSKR